MKPAVWRIFQNNRWSYSNDPSTRHHDRPAWQPLYAVPEKEWQDLTEQDWSDFMKSDWGDVKNGGHVKMRLVWEFARARLKEKNA